MSTSTPKPAREEFPQYVDMYHYRSVPDKTWEAMCAEIDRLRTGNAEEVRLVANMMARESMAVIDSLRAERDGLAVERDQLRHALTGLLDFTDRHRVTWPEHDHDCYELWKIEQEYARQLLRPEDGKQ